MYCDFAAMIRGYYGTILSIDDSVGRLYEALKQAGRLDDTIFVFTADNGLLNKRGTIAMARTSDPQSATAQFFINFADNAFLDYKSPTPQGWGYAVFGEVVQGQDIVDKMATIPTGSGGPMPSDVPKTAIVIKKATVVEAK